MPGDPYRAAVGIHDMSGWSFTITENETRLVPDNHPDGCQIVFLGDSVAFGMGVNDDETFVNMLAKWHGLNATIAAYPGYNIDNVIQAKKQWPGQRYLYLSIDNDLDGQWVHPIDIWRPSNALQAYVVIWRVISLPVSEIAPERAAEYVEKVKSLGAEVAGISSARLTRILLDAGIHVATINHYESISRTDAHPNRRGNEQIADILAPVIQRMCASLN